MPILLLAEHDNAAIKPATLNAVTAAGKIGGEIHLLVAGHNANAAADAGAQIPGIAKVLLCDDAAYANGLAENLANLLVKLAPSYSHLAAATTAISKSAMPRAAALAVCCPYEVSRFEDGAKSTGNEALRVPDIIELLDEAMGLSPNGA